MRTSRALPGFFCLLFLTSACEEAAPPPPPVTQQSTAAAPSPAPSETPAGSPSSLVLRDADGKPLLTLEKRDGTWRVENASGEKIAKVKVEPDRVKVKDLEGTLRAKAKKKDGGVKLEGPEERLVFKAKRRSGGKLKVKNDSESFGKVTGGKGELQGHRVRTEPGKTGTRVEVDGKPRWTVPSTVSPEMAVLLAFEGLDDFHRAALMVFAQEVR